MVKKLALACALLIALTACKAAPRVVEPVEKTSAEKAVTALKVTQYDKDSCEKAKSEAEAYEFDKKAVAGIIPHHGTAAKMMAGWFKMLSDDYDTVVIVGPNHFNELGGIVYAACDWETEYGTVDCDSELAETLGKSQDIKAVQGDEKVQNDHSVTWHIPYVADYLPSAKVVPVMVSPLTSKTQLNALVEAIAAYAGDKSVLVVGSIDFSHYLMPEQAMKNNELTKKIVDAEDYGRLMELDSDYIDSPETMYVVMKVCEALNVKLTLLDESISTRQSGMADSSVDPGDGTTTYLVYAG